MSTTTTTAEAATLDDILALVARLAERRAALGQAVFMLNELLQAAKDEHMPRVTRLSVEAAAAWSALERAIDANRALFERPRTQVSAGIKFGLEKGKGALEIADARRTLELIRKRLPDLAKVLIDTVETPSKKAISALTASELKAIGVSVKEAGDQVVIRPADGAIDKLVKALIKEATALASEAL